MKLVGLTGGIGTGKSSVSRHLRSHGVSVIDCDQLARDVVEPGTPALRSIVATFGSEVLVPATGALDRAKLGALIFADDGKRRALNAITHPAIKREIARRVVEYWLRGRPLVVVDAPLLVESGLYKWMTDVVVVYCPDDIQRSRLMARDGLDVAAAEARMRAQAPMTEKLAHATHVLDNAGSLDDLFRQVDALVPKLTPPRWKTWLWRVVPLGVVFGTLVGAVAGMAYAVGFAVTAAAPAAIAAGG
ncbi:CoaE-domain-containing protein [Blastocladiella britannica]|nr:CoaE-domain-containing protein [Blastocladiella britannica]